MIHQVMDRRATLKKIGASGWAALQKPTLAVAGGVTPLAGCGGEGDAGGSTYPYGKIFSSTEELASYTRLSSLRNQALPLAHRSGHGPMGGLPENCLSGAREILNTCPALIELDVRTSQDQQLVVHYAADLAHSTTGQGLLKNASLAELHRLHLKDINGVVTQERMSTLDNYLELTRQGALLWLDIKAARPEAIVAAIRNQKAENQVVVSAYGLENLDKYQKLAPELVYFIPKDPKDLPTLHHIFNRIADLRRMIGFAGWYVPNFDDWNVLRQNDIPGLLELSRGDARRPPELVDERVYATAVDEGFPIFCTNQYRRVAELLQIRQWPEPAGLSKSVEAGGLA